MTREEERALNSIAVSMFGKQWIMLDEAEAERVLRERARQAEVYLSFRLEGKASAEANTLAATHFREGNE